MPAYEVALSVDPSVFDYAGQNRLSYSLGGKPDTASKQKHYKTNDNGSSEWVERVLGNALIGSESTGHAKPQ